MFECSLARCRPNGAKHHLLNELAEFAELAELAAPDEYEYKELTSTRRSSSATFGSSMEVDRALATSDRVESMGAMGAMGAMGVGFNASSR